MNRLVKGISFGTFALLCYFQIWGQPSSESRFQVPEGFVVEVAAPPEQTGSLIALTFDSFGRPVVSKERGHPTILLDRDGDGVFEAEKIFSDQVKYLQGMWFEGRTLYAVGNDSANKKAGLYRLADTDGDDQADTFETLLLFTGGMGEHGPHNIRRGPDGYPIILLGNHTAIPDELVDPLSPLKGYKESQLLPRYMDARGHAVNVMAPGGTIWRLDFKEKKYTRLVGGFRNPYGYAFNWEGELFTFDSDMEWDLGLPWFRAVRSVHAVPGGDYGWRTGSGKWPEYYIDSLPPLREVGRGSPVSVEFYYHYAYPEEYYGAYLEGDWSRGRILITKLSPKGATYQVDGPSRDFVYGEPLNVTDLEVGPDGFLYFVTGGRDTEGGLYRVAYRGSKPNLPRMRPTGVMAAVRQPQPLSSWGHAELLKLKNSMGESWGRELAKLAHDATAESMDRVQALFLLRRFGPKPGTVLLEPLSKDRDARVRAAAVFAVGLHSDAAAKVIAGSALKDPDPFVRRRALEALVRMGLSPGNPSFAPVEDIYALLDDADRFVRYAARLALERTPRNEWKDAALSENSPHGSIEGLVALTRKAQTEDDLKPVFEKELHLLKRQDLAAEDILRLLRAFHLTALEAQEGAPPEVRRQVHDLISPRFPTRDERLNTEYARTLAYCARPPTIGQILAALPQAAENQTLQIHYVYCLRTIKTGWTAKQKKALLGWFEKAQRWRGGASFVGYINRLFDSSMQFFTPEEKKLAYARIPDYAPLDDVAAAGRAEGYQRAHVFERKKGVEGVSEQEIFEYIIYDPMTLKASPERGKKIYEKVQCSLCHRFGDMGRDYGPDLTTLGSRFTRKDIIEGTLWPSRTISDIYAALEITTKGGKKFTGTLVAEDEENVKLQDIGLGLKVSIPKRSIQSRTVSEISTMPEGLLDALSMAEIADLMAFLQSGTEKSQ